MESARGEVKDAMSAEGEALMRRVARLARGTASLAMASALAACALIPSERPQPGPLPDAWIDAPAGAADPASLTDWWRGFNDPVLDELIADALINGGSVQLAALRVREARAQTRASVASVLPRIDGFGRGRYNQALDGPDLRTADGLGTEAEQMSGDYGPQIAWEVPLFGRIEATALGTRASRRLAQSDYRGAQVALAADTAQTYVGLRAAQQSRAALRDAVANADQLANILAISAEAGFASPSDAADARRQAETNRAQLPNVEIEVLRAERALAVLRGRAPGADAPDVSAALQAVSTVPTLAITAAPPAPADLVRLRPDVAQAEANALIAAAQVGLARGDLLPQLNLTGQISIVDNLIGMPVANRTGGLSLTPFITIPLFAWGQRQALADASDARFEQALVRYRDTVNSAVGEAANALTALDQGARRLTAARAAEAAAEIAARGQRAAQEAGIRSLADRLRSDQLLIDARLTRIEAEAAQANAAIAVYRAFGGGPSNATPPRDARRVAGPPAAP